MLYSSVSRILGKEEGGGGKKLIWVEWDAYVLFLYLFDFVDK